MAHKSNMNSPSKITVWWAKMGLSARRALFSDSLNLWIIHTLTLVKAFSC